MTTPDEPPAHTYNPGHPFWNDSHDGAQPATPESQRMWQEAMDAHPPIFVRSWVPGDPEDPSQITGTFDRDSFARERQGNFLGPAWDPYVGPHPEEAALYEQMRERQAAHQPAITREELQRQGILPPDPIQVRVSEDVRRALMGGASMETVQARLAELGFEYIGDIGPEGIQRTPLPELVSGDIIQVAQPEEFRIEDVYAAIRAVHADPGMLVPPMPEAEEPAGNRATRRQGCQCGNPNRAYTVHRQGTACRPMNALERRRQQVSDVIGPAGDPNDMVNPLHDPLPWQIVGHDVERHTVDVEFTNETPVDRNADPMTAIRTRPLAGGGAVGAGGGGYARQSTTWAAGGAAGAGGSGGGGTARGHGIGMAGAGGDPYLVTGTGETLRERLMRHGVTEATPNLDDDIEVAPMEPRPVRYVAPTAAKRAQAHMDEIFAELDTKSRGELIDLIGDMRKDWEALNDIHNRRANRSGWCSEYEERQERHNATFRALKLMSRVENGPSDEYSGSGL